MTTISLSKSIDAAPARVWSVITDLAGSTDTMTSVERIERLDGGTEFEVGTRWLETRNLFGRTATEELVVTSLSDGESYTVEADGHGAHYVSILTVARSENGTTLTMDFTATPSTTFSRIMTATVGRAFLGATRKALQQDLVDIAKASEHG